MKIIKNITYSVLISFFLCHLALSQEQQTPIDINKTLSIQSEKLLMSALEHITNSRVNDALKELKTLIKLNPSFDLAQLIYADLTLAKSQPVSKFGNHHENNKKTIALREELRVRWDYYKFPVDKTLIPSPLVQLAETIEYALVVDQSRNRMFLYKNQGGVPTYVADFYITIGKNGVGKVFEGDKKTPLGVYFITGFINSEKLPDLYGDGAFPINYPNLWDKRNARTGTGIWLHGTPSTTFSRPPQDSNGCITISNDGFKQLFPYIKKKQQTPIILAKKINWITQAEWNKRRKIFNSHLDRWKRDRESLDNKLYQQYYSNDYKAFDKNHKILTENQRYKKLLKNYSLLNLNNISIFLYPIGTDEIMITNFIPNNFSKGLHGIDYQRQYWKMEEDGTWRIIFEKSV